MKKIIKTIIVMTMLLVMASIAPLNDLKPAHAETESTSDTEKKNTNPDGTLYISDVKVAFCYTDEDRDSDGKDSGVRELESEGYTVLRGPNKDYEDGSGYADLNCRAGSDSVIKKGPNDKRVYLGYKTTTDPADAITDMAVMNMKGGYDFEEYNLLLEKHMDSQIKPFVDMFIAAIEEYRVNCNKPKDTLNYKRANYMRRMLNELSDDDTGGLLGDLLLNKTKYEMGDAAYNKLSDAEKKNHADILTIIMQANGQAVLSMETLLSRATDTAKNSWVDRMAEISLEDLEAEIAEENPDISSSEDLDYELDKKYNDVARTLLNQWDSIYDIVKKDEQTIEEAQDLIDEIENGEGADDEAKVMEAVKAAEAAAICEYLDGISYGTGSMLDFFRTKEAELSKEKNIRKLYPMVEALSDGQIAGLQFLSIKDLVSIAMTGEEGYEYLDTDTQKAVSVYDGVNRELYEKGGVALTNKARRDKAMADAGDGSFVASDCTQILYKVTAAVAAVAAAAFLGKAVVSIVKKVNAVRAENTEYLANIAYESMRSGTYDFAHKVLKWLGVGFTVCAAILAGVSIYFTIAELDKYYNGIEFTVIPKYMVEETDITSINERGEKVVLKNQTAYYKVVTCNRWGYRSGVDDEDWDKLLDDNYRILEDRADLNGDVGQQWLALYTVKYKDAAPILADSLKVVTGTKTAKAPDDSYRTGIHMFGEDIPFNLNSTQYCYNDKLDGYFVWFKKDNRTVSEMTGSIFSAGSIAIGGGIGIVLGGILGALVVIAAKRRKRNTDEGSFV